MPARHAVLLTLPSDGNRPPWSYRYTGTLPRLISFVSHSYANTGGVGVFFPFWDSTSAVPVENSLLDSSSFFSNSCALFCTFLHSPKIQPFSFQSFPHSLPKKKYLRAWASSNLRPSTFNSQSSALHVQFPPRVPGGVMTFSQRFDEVRTGFERPFWVANITEIFERLSYYGAFASLANYLHEKLNFPTEQ